MFSQKGFNLQPPSPIPADVPDEVLIQVESVSKRFCRDFKKSLWYGICDVVKESIGKSQKNPCLRPEEFWAVDELSFELRRGECLGLIGHNGAGKTTLLKMLNGLIKPDRGVINIRGTVGALIALGAGFNPILTGRENVYVNGAILGKKKREIDEIFHNIVEFSELEKFIDAPVQSYSSGMQVRLGFAIAAQLEPDIMLVDEVLAVGDHTFHKKCYERIYELKNSGTSFIVVSHNPYQLERLCEKVAVLEQGQMLALCSPKEAIKTYHVSAVKKTVTSKQVPNPKREGSGEALIRQVSLRSFKGRTVNELSTQQNASFVIRLSVFEPLKNLRFRFEVFSDSNLEIAVISSYDHSEEWSLETGDHEVTFSLANLPLLPGAFSIDVMIVNTSGVRIDTVRNANHFTINDAPDGVISLTGLRGLISLDGEWDHSPMEKPSDTL